ncbi:regulator [Nocardia araoensis]|uniref:regulator n=1 Tax=Nocardia araoensis TaxID=228600 RepID=UPI001FDFF170
MRDGHGQLARATTNKDALVLSMLTEAQSGSAARTIAAPCPLRGMRRASVVTADAPGVQLATTASLLLAAAKIRDHVDDGEVTALARGPLTKAATRWNRQARASAARIGLDVEPLVAALDAQVRLEELAAVGGPAFVPKSLADSPYWRSAMSPAADPLDRLTAPTQLCASEFFAHTAVLADRPDNVDALRAAGWQFGRIAHLADAVTDHDDDAARDRFNPLAATGTSVSEAYDLMRQSDSRLRAAVAAAELSRVPTVRWMLLDPLTAVLRRLGGGLGAFAAHTCSVSADAEGSPRADVRAHSRGTRHRPPTRRPGIGESLALILGGYCTGYACCADHTQPCTGERKDAWINNCDCGDCGGCDCGDCNCCDCGCDC